MGENADEMTQAAVGGDGGGGGGEQLSDFEMYGGKDFSTEGTNPLPFIIIGVVVGVILLIIIYVVVVKLCCAEQQIGMPASVFQSKFAAKLQSSSSIKTIKSSEELKAAAAAAKSVPKGKTGTGKK